VVYDYLGKEIPLSRSVIFCHTVLYMIVDEWPPLWHVDNLTESRVSIVSAVQVDALISLNSENF
jgi:hypothetical protein